MSHEFEPNDLIMLDQDLVGQSSPAVMQRALEYANLAALPNPSEQQANRLGEILEEAVENEILSFWITEIDHFLGHYLDLLDDNSRESYQDQQALIREYAETNRDNFPVPDDQQISEPVCCPLTPNCNSSDTSIEDCFYPHNERVTP